MFKTLWWICLEGLQKAINPEEQEAERGFSVSRAVTQGLVAVEGDSVGDIPEPWFWEPELCRSVWPPGGSVGQRVPCPGAGTQMMALGFLLFSFFPSFLLFLHYPLQPGAPNLNKPQVSSVSCSVNL